eukprot:1272288-Rhodomonas_salina.1
MISPVLTSGMLLPGCEISNNLKQGVLLNSPVRFATRCAVPAQRMGLSGYALARRCPALN